MSEGEGFFLASLRFGLEDSGDQASLCDFPVDA